MADRHSGGNAAARHVTLGSVFLLCASLLWGAVTLFNGLEHVGGACTDDFARAYFSSLWIARNNLFDYPNFLPGYPFLYGILFRLTGHIFFVAHALTAFFAAGTMYLAGLLAIEAGGRRASAALTVLLLCSTPLWIWLSSSMLSEPMFYAFALLLLLGAVRWIRTQARAWILTSLLASVAMSLTRYEGWPLSVLLALFVLYKGAWRPRFWLYAALSLTPILSWLVLNHAYFGDPLHFLRTQQAESVVYFARQSGDALPPNLKMLVLFLGQFGYVLPAIGLALFSSRGVRFLALLSLLELALTLMMLWNVVPTATVFPARSLMFAGLLGILTTSAVISEALGKRSGRRTAFAVLIGLIAIGCLWSGRRFDPRDFDPKTMDEILLLRKSHELREAVRRRPFACQIDTDTCTAIPVVLDQTRHVISLPFDVKTGTFYAPSWLRQPPEVFL
ncbi:MAG: hypothetical protein V1798_05795 [Pseudomonadota bacterium]